MTPRSKLFLGSVAFLLTVACERTDRPVDPVWGKEPCSHCAMLVGDRRFAAEIVVNGERRFFDDIGCYVLWTSEHPRAKVEHAWVREAEEGRWIDASSARYVQGARTPMDFGFEARDHSVTLTSSMTLDEMRVVVLARAQKQNEGAKESAVR